MKKNIPKYLIQPINSLEENIEYICLAILNKEIDLYDWMYKKTSNILKYWSINGCENSLHLIKAQNFDMIQRLLNNIKVYSRLDGNLSQMVINPNKVNSYNHTSGSSGRPFRYPVSKNWLASQHVLWRLAYQQMSKKEIKSYLDPNYLWAMARPPGGHVDNLINTIECIPEKGSINYSESPSDVRPDVVHGSINTILEMLENKYVRNWNPTYIFLTYESISDYQIQLVRKYWDKSKIRIEYSSNDGGGLAFSCEHHKLHYWPLRSLPLFRDGNLCTIDFFNEAMSFVGYSCGDIVSWETSNCECGSIFNEVKIKGRVSGFLTLDDGKRISTFNPLDSNDMFGLSSFKIYVLKNNVAYFQYVEDEFNSFRLENKEAISGKLKSIGFKIINFEKVSSINDLREESLKFRVIVDKR